MTKRWRETEFAVADYLKDAWPFAEAVNSGAGGSDVKGTPGITWEVKARKDFNPKAVLKQARGHGGDYQVAVMRPDGSGPATVEEWPAFIRFGDMVRLLRLAGYGEPLDEMLSVGEAPEVSDPDTFHLLAALLEEAKQLVLAGMADQHDRTRSP